jgi:uncharacterized protein YegJ (DUF2314 family)
MPLTDGRRNDKARRKTKMGRQNKDIRVVCTRCLAPDPELAAKGAPYFVGKLVKKLFTEEHMWVFIDGFTDDVLTGTLENEPILMMCLKMGDRVEVRLNEIEDMRDLGTEHRLINNKGAAIL